jgi:hypothetical protein
MLNMSGMSGEGLGMSGMSPLGFNKSIYPDQTHQRVLDYEFETDPFKKLVNYIQL